MGHSCSVPQPEDLPLADRLDALGIRPGERPTVEHITNGIRAGKFQRIAILCGAGISVSAGIPDFRTKGTGLYDQLEKYDLPTPQSIFDLRYFKERPEAFNKLARELFPGQYSPTVTHYFIKLLEDKGLLEICMTQNIDTLERQAGVSPGSLVECHGSFAGASCVECKRKIALGRYKELLMSEETPRCGHNFDVSAPLPPPSEDLLAGLERNCQEALERKDQAMRELDTSALMQRMSELKGFEAVLQDAREERESYTERLAKWEAGAKKRACRGLVKADITFFGEAMPENFHTASEELKECDLCIIMGTSLKVMPFASLIGKLNPLCPRLLINREAVAVFGDEESGGPMGDAGFRFEKDDNYRDVFLPGDCDSGVRLLCEKLGWSGDLSALRARVKGPDVLIRDRSAVI